MFCRKCIIMVMFVVGVSVLSGCNGNMYNGRRAEYLERHWGEAYHTARCNQILNPYAGRTQCGLQKLDGQTAIRIKRKYLETFVEEDIQPHQINIRLD